MGAKEITELTAAVLVAAASVVALSRWSILRTRCEQAATCLASHPWRCVLVVALLPVAFRLALLPWFSPPKPFIHDEFGHLLVADTLLAGRLANPSHPLAKHFETIYVLQKPAYASKYTVGQGVALAVGRVLTGHPWGGVLLAVAAMSGAITWMLFGCVPPPWAALGGVMAALLHGMNMQWIDRYWGGAFCAFGGALLCGALVRLHRRPSVSLSLLAGGGWAICWLIRPFESLLMLALLWITILCLALRNRNHWKAWAASIGSLLFVLGLAACVTLLHNYRVTGSPLTIPYRLSQKVYGVPQNLILQPTVPEPEHLTLEQHRMYLYQRDAKEYASKHPTQNLVQTLLVIYTFFVGPWWLYPLLIAFFFNDFQTRLAALILICGVLWSSLYSAIFSQYFAAYSCVLVALTVRGLMVLFSLKPFGMRIGQGIAIFLIAGGLFAAVARVPMSRYREERSLFPVVRTEAESELTRRDGPHVAFIRYGPTHTIHAEWVYNTADIDASPIVWCRSGSPEDDLEVMRYYPSRRYWLIDVEGFSARISPYRAVPQPNGSVAPVAQPPVWRYSR